MSPPPGDNVRRPPGRVVPGPATAPRKPEDPPDPRRDGEANLSKTVAMKEGGPGPRGGIPASGRQPSEPSETVMLRPGGFTLGGGAPAYVYESGAHPQPNPAPRPPHSQPPAPQYARPLYLSPQPFPQPHPSAAPHPHAPAAAPSSRPLPSSERPPARGATPSGAPAKDSTMGGGPGSFSRIFLSSLEKYQAKTGEVGTVSEEAAAVLAQKATPDTRKAKRAPTLRLRSPLAILEALVFTLLALGVGWLIDHSDPFFLTHRFNWLVFAPLLLGLRHGFAPALGSAIVLDGLIAVSWRMHWFPIDRLPAGTMLGITALAMVTGQFSDVWKRELVRLDGGFEVLRRQLGEVMRAHFLLELSHDRLEERVGRGTPNLRDALAAVERSLALRPNPTIVDLGDTIVETFAAYTMVEVAALHRVQGGRLVEEPIARIGRPKPLARSDEQLQKALATKRLTYIGGGGGGGAGPGSDARSPSRTQLLAVVPFVDSLGDLHAVLAVESIPLLAFERRNLDALAILGGHFADAISSKRQSVQGGQRKELEIRLRRAIHNLRDNDVPSTVFVVMIRKGSAVSDSVEAVLGGTLRALDFPYVQRDGAGNYVVYILLPLTDDAGARALGARIERIVRRESNVPLSRSGGFHFHHVLRPDDTVEKVMKDLETRATLDEAAVEHTIVV